MAATKVPIDMSIASILLPIEKVPRSPLPSTPKHRTQRSRNSKLPEYQKGNSVGQQPSQLPSVREKNHNRIWQSIPSQALDILVPPQHEPPVRTSVTGRSSRLPLQAISALSHSLRPSESSQPDLLVPSNHTPASLTSKALPSSTQANSKALLENRSNSESSATPTSAPKTLLEKREAARIAEQKRRERFSLAIQRIAESLPTHYKTLHRYNSDKDGGDTGSRTRKRQRIFAMEDALEMAIE
ncbi:hypothetical protein DL98DRAFT_599069 [Cadophora sp. DSE1049]|nr:hypothetical protein DL98DRAFT_599069 [Cadophora sp. DSE1049]